MGPGAPCADPGPSQMVGQPFGHLTAAGVPHAHKENLHGRASWRLRCFFRLAHLCFKTFYHSMIARLAAPRRAGLRNLESGGNADPAWRGPRFVIRSEAGGTPR